MERWLAIPNFEGYYEVSTLGNIRSVTRQTHKKNGVTVTTKGKVLKQETTDKGYKRITLTKDSKKYRFLVHRLVAEAFIPNTDELPQVNHVDGDKSNNTVENLEWITNYGNYEHAERYGLRASHNKAKPVGQYDMDGNLVATYRSTSHCGTALGIKNSRVSDVCRGKRKTANGFTFRFI